MERSRKKRQDLEEKKKMIMMKKKKQEEERTAASKSEGKATLKSERIRKQEEDKIEKERLKKLQEQRIRKNEQRRLKRSLEKEGTHEERQGRGRVPNRAGANQVQPSKAVAVAKSQSGTTKSGAARKTKTTTTTTRSKPPSAGSAASRASKLGRSVTAHVASNSKRRTGSVSVLVTDPKPSAPTAVLVTGGGDDSSDNEALFAPMMDQVSKSKKENVRLSKGKGASAPPSRKRSRATGKDSSKKVATANNNKKRKNSTSNASKKATGSSSIPPLPPSPRDQPNVPFSSPLSSFWRNSSSDLTLSKGLDSGGKVLGLPLVWDDGYFSDDPAISQKALPLDPNPKSSADSTQGSAQPLSQATANSVGSIFSDQECDPNACYATCNCGQTLQANESNKDLELGTTSRKARRITGGKKSARFSAIHQELINGTLNPHTLIAPELYIGGPDLRFLSKVLVVSSRTDASVFNNERGYAFFEQDSDDEEPTASPFIELGRHAGFWNIQPFAVVVNPHVCLLADFHSHLVDCEVIGLLAGRYDDKEKTIFVQAAFPCTATQQEDGGATDVEMDPVSQIIAQDAIAKHGLEVVGWYHNHPAFQPDPSVTDIENQQNYQQLMKSLYHGKAMSSDHVVPFVGLIVGTYDKSRTGPASVMRWFHCRSDATSSSSYPVGLKTTTRVTRKVSPSGGRLELTSNGRQRRKNARFERLKRQLELFEETRVESFRFVPKKAADNKQGGHDAIAADPLGGSDVGARKVDDEVLVNGSIEKISEQTMAVSQVRARSELMSMLVCPPVPVPPEAVIAKLIGKILDSYKIICVQVSTKRREKEMRAKAVLDAALQASKNAKSTAATATAKNASALPILPKNLLPTFRAHIEANYGVNQGDLITTFLQQNREVCENVTKKQIIRTMNALCIKAKPDKGKFVKWLWRKDAKATAPTAAKENDRLVPNNNENNDDSGDDSKDSNEGTRACVESVVCEIVQNVAMTSAETDASPIPKAPEIATMCDGEVTPASAANGGPASASAATSPANTLYRLTPQERLDFDKARNALSGETFAKVIVQTLMVDNASFTATFESEKLPEPPTLPLINDEDVLKVLLCEIEEKSSVHAVYDMLKHYGSSKRKIKLAETWKGCKEKLTFFEKISASVLRWFQIAGVNYTISGGDASLLFLLGTLRLLQCIYTTREAFEAYEKAKKKSRKNEKRAAQVLPS